MLFLFVFIRLLCLERALSRTINNIIWHLLDITLIYLNTSKYNNTRMTVMGRCRTRMYTQLVIVLRKISKSLTLLQ